MSETRRVDEQASGGGLCLGVGETFEVLLPELRTGGYRWTLTSVGAPAVEAAVNAYEPPKGAVGEPGVRIWRFHAVQVGRGHIEIIYSRPWEYTKLASKTFTLEVTVSGK